MAMHDSLDHDALAPFSRRIGGSGLSRPAENIAYGYADFADTLKQWINSARHRANLRCTVRSGLALLMHKMATELIGQWSSGRSKALEIVARTTKQALMSSTDQGGGKRRAGNGATAHTFLEVLHQSFLKARVIAAIIPRPYAR